MHRAYLDNGITGCAALQEHALCSASEDDKMKGKTRRKDEDKKRNRLCTSLAKAHVHFGQHSGRVLLLSALALSITKLRSRD